MMRVFFLAPAQQELRAAKRHYDGLLPGLGDRFKIAALETARRLIAHPLAWQIECAPVRRCLLEGFPYKFLYVVRDHDIIVVAVAHQHRYPDYWIERLDSL